MTLWTVLSCSCDSILKILLFNLYIKTLVTISLFPDHYLGYICVFYPLFRLLLHSINRKLCKKFPACQSSKEKGCLPWQGTEHLARFVPEAEAEGSRQNPSHHGQPVWMSKSINNSGSPSSWAISLKKKCFLCLFWNMLPASLKGTCLHANQIPKKGSKQLQRNAR